MLVIRVGALVRASAGHAAGLSSGPHRKTGERTSAQDRGTQVRRPAGTEVPDRADEIRAAGGGGPQRKTREGNAEQHSVRGGVAGVGQLLRGSERDAGATEEEGAGRRRRVPRKKNKPVTFV